MMCSLSDDDTDTEIDQDENVQANGHRATNKRQRSSECPSQPELPSAHLPIQLNVGGQLFTTTQHTLTTIADTYFTNILLPHGRAHSSSYFIDRDATHFNIILNFCRDAAHISNELLRHRHTAALIEIAHEAEFYSLHQLSAACREEIDRRDLEEKRAAAFTSGINAFNGAAYYQSQVLAPRTGAIAVAINGRSHSTPVGTHSPLIGIQHMSTTDHTFSLSEDF